MNQDSEILRILRSSNVGPTVLEVRTERFSELTWMRFRGRDGYQVVECEWDLSATVDSVAADLLKSATALTDPA